jgi:hypothetical protein
MGANDSQQQLASPPLALAASFREELGEWRREEYSSPDSAAGHCYDAAYNFAEHCSVAGLPATAIYWEYTETGGRELVWADPEAEDYAGASGFAGEVDESCEHMLAFVRLPAGDFAVDFTCAQFGFVDEFPKIMPLASLDGRAVWTRT